MIIESTKELSYFLEQVKNSDIFLTPIFKDQKRHPANNTLSLLYVGVLETHEEFMLAFDHGEKDHDVYTIDILRELDTEHKKFTYDKKLLLHLFPWKNILDVNLMYYFVKKEPWDIDGLETDTHIFFNRLYYDRDDINSVIPIMKHHQFCSELASRSMMLISKWNYVLDSETYNIYNEIVIPNFHSIESTGLYIDENLFNNFFKDKTSHHSPKSKYLYTNYNIFTATGRPSNSFGGINFAALKKDNGERAMFKSRHKCDGALLELDYDAFHIRLIADLVGYKFPDNISVHNYLGEQYFDKTDLTQEEYEKSKNLTFKLLYGGISDEFKEIPFFKVVDKYIYSIWSIVNTDGYVESKLFGRKISKTDSNFSRQKLFNYVIQCHETEFNALIIEKILEVLPSFNSEIILYTYDSILFDMHITDGKKFVDTVRSIMENGDKFPVKIKYGTNYHDMKDLGKYGKRIN